MSLRTSLGLVVVVVAAAAIAALFRSGAPAVESARFASSAGCRDCHREVYQEWASSWHARSFTDADVRSLSNDFANAECIPCHAPQPVLVTGLEESVLARAARREEGVDCIACHALAGADEGRVAGTIERPDVACMPAKRAELSSTAFCAACHNQHQTLTEWVVTSYAAQGVGCIDCHMPFRGGDPRRGRDHSMHGGHSLETLRAAVDLRAWREGGRVLVEVENKGAGHCFPTDERTRAADVFWRPLRSDAGPWRSLYRFRSPYRYETDVTETVLPAQETVRVPLEDPDAAGAIEVALFYKLTPYWADPGHPDPEKEARLVERVELLP